MGKNAVVITGIGVIAPNGIGKDEFWQGLKEGRSGIRPITVFETAFFKSKTAGEVVGFEAETYLGPKGLRNLDRGTRFLCSAAKLALDDAGLKVTEENTQDIGVVTATTFSVIWNISEFTKDAHTEGVANPAMFPGTTINAPSSQVSIKYGIKGFNATVSTGYTASLDALKYAVDFIRMGRAQAVLLAGVESLFFQSFVGFSRLDFLAGSRGPEISCPFDKRHNGIVLGEGAGVIILENEEFARKRNARVYARLAAVESLFDPFRSGRYSPKVEGLKRVITACLKDSGLEAEEIDYVCASANSVPEQDMLETRAIKEVFGEIAAAVPLSSIKSMIGETVSAAGVFQMASAVGAIQQGFVPPTINYKERDTECDLDCVPNTSRKKDIKNVLISNFGPGGTNAAAIVSRYA
jgi:3-oxoacyl-[acyl-carrier-protein] synthase II